MNDTIVITSIYKPFWGTEEFMKSCARVGLPVHNAYKAKHFTGNGDAIRMIYEALVELKGKYKYAIYADGADSIFLKSFTPPEGRILYSTEKAIWPPTEDMKDKWEDYYFILDQESIITSGKELIVSPWKYLNGGGYCGEINILIEFFQKYGLDKLKGDVNGQDHQALAFLKAHAEGFPIYLDTQCNFFQTTGFEDPGDFEYGPNHDGMFFRNQKTGSFPSVLHGNGRTEMQQFYTLLNI